MFAESPIELALLRALDYRLQAGALLVPQVELPTQGGDFRADFLLVAGEQITLIECDGADFHTDLLDDHLRSAFILHAGWADQVLRFSGTMLHHAPDDAALWVNAVAPEALGERVALALRRLATSETAEEIDAQAKALRAGHVSARYYAHVQNLNVDPDLGKATMPARVFALFDRVGATEGHVAELLRVLQASPAASRRELERAYRAQHDPESNARAVAAEIRERVRRREAAQERAAAAKFEAPD